MVGLSDQSGLVPDADWKGGEGAPECVLTVRAGPRTTWVASGHVIGASDIDRWADALGAWAHGSVREIGALLPALRAATA